MASKKGKNLETVLAECAVIRGVGCVEHRIIHEFNWFVQSVIFGTKEEKEKVDKYLRPEDFDTNGLKGIDEVEKKITGWGKAFRRYYEDKEKEYDEFNKEEISKIVTGWLDLKEFKLGGRMEGNGGCDGQGNL
jgi:hypothetical protein